VGKLFPIAGTSITHRLISRSITGLNMNLQIHNHFGHKIHISWNAHSYPLLAENKNCANKYMANIAKTAPICLERNDILDHRIIKIIDSLNRIPYLGFVHVCGVGAFRGNSELVGNSHDVRIWL
jgi:hypothetical protein